MPFFKLWSLAVCDGKLFVKIEDEVLTKYGPLSRIRSSDRPTHIKVCIGLSSCYPRSNTNNAGEVYRH